jgi:low temperature requirement protein LtrA
MSTVAANARRLIRPPALRTAESATASRLELFFDLAYVLVVLELADAFYADMTWQGAVVFVALFVALWFSWIGFTLYANLWVPEIAHARLDLLVHRQREPGMISRWRCG